ncbi:Protein-lysine N-methyltransferase efm6 [Pleosporales sp. CAS-2024a]
MSDSEENDVFGVSQDLVPPAPIKPAGASEIDFDGLLSPPLKLHEDLKNGIELGAGGGLVGLAVAMGCKTDRPLHMTDQEPMLELMKRNIALNRLESRATASIYNWGASKPSQLPPPDIILAADCVYFEPAFPLLQQTLSDLIGDNTVCYFCFKKRRRADLQFIKVAKKMFDVKQVDDDPDKEIYSRENLFLYRFTKKRI